MGPEGGFRGGLVIATGTPEQVAKNPASYTGQYLSRVLAVKAVGKVAAKARPKAGAVAKKTASKGGKAKLDKSQAG